MPRDTQEIEITPADRDRGKVMRHPAFGQIAVHRVSGRKALYGSDFEHNGYMAVTIRTSELHRDLSHDCLHGRDTLIEVHLSEAQWATFVSSHNIGEGSPCTISYRKDEGLVPGFELPDRKQMFNNEMAERLEKTIAGFRKTLDEIDNMGLPKGKAAKLKGQFEHAIMELNSNVPFVMKTFSEHMEKTVEKAKVEVHGYMHSTLQRAGLAALQEKYGPPLAIEANEDGPDIIPWDSEAKK